MSVDNSLPPATGRLWLDCLLNPQTPQTTAQQGSMTNLMDAERAHPWLDPPEGAESPLRQEGKRRLYYDEVLGVYVKDPTPSTHGRPRTFQHPLREATSSWPIPDSELPFFTLREGSSPERGLGSVDSPIGSPEPLYRQNALFLTKQDPAPEGHPSAAGCAIERTRSGLSISSDSAYEKAVFDEAADQRAALRVREHLSRSRPDTKRERILRSLIHPKADFRLDDDALESIFSAANDIFFHGRLSQRVRWDWSHESYSQYNSRIIGTTNLREAAGGKGGYECLIVLSSPILEDTQYNRRLLISTFLHELIHCYLFVCNGFGARAHGGHTPGFRDIAWLVDGWAGRGTLHLCDMEADLERFRVVDPPPPPPPPPQQQQQHHHHHHRHQQRSPLLSDHDEDCPPRCFPSRPASAYGGASWESGGGGGGGMMKMKMHDRWGPAYEPLPPPAVDNRQRYVY